MTNSFYIKIYKLHKEDIYLLAGTLGFFTTVIYLIIDYVLCLLFKAKPVPILFFAVSIISCFNELGFFLWSNGGFNRRNFFGSFYRFGIGANEL